MSDNPIRYSIITQKNPREILMLRGSGCKWKRCTFCDYHLDASPNEEENYALNKAELAKVTGLYHKLEVINSGSVFELDEKTMTEIMRVCVEKHIHEIHFETHWMYRKQIAKIRERFSAIGVQIKFKIGVETFDEAFRENVYCKGMAGAIPEMISNYCDEVCLLFGVEGQTEQSMRYDIETGLRYFERVCVNIMIPNTTDIRPDQKVIDTFLQTLYPVYRHNERVDILIENTDFGVGGEQHDQ